MKLKIPQFLKERPAFLTRKPGKSRPKRLHAATAARRMAPGVEDDYDDEPTTRLSSAFFVVLILHVVAVGGIYAFNSIKAHRRGFEPTAKSGAAKTGNPADERTTPKLTGEQVALPVKAGTGAETSLLPSPIASGSNARVYQVKQGDTLTKIAQLHGISVAELQMVNTSKDTALLRPGQALNLPLPKSGARAPISAGSDATKADGPLKKVDSAPATKTYAMQKGETATSIAKKFGVSVSELLKLNKISDPTKMQPGQTLKVPTKRG
jgi:LysM repeat protein